MYYGGSVAAILLLPFVIYIIITIIIAKKMEYTAKLKGYEKTSDVFWMVFFFNIIGVLYAVALPDLYARNAYKKSEPEEISKTSLSQGGYRDLPKI